MKNKKSSPITILQTIVLSFLYFFDNSLYAYSLACSFGLLYSAIPFILLLLMILIRILQQTPQLVKNFIQYISSIIRSFIGSDIDLTKVQDSITSFFEKSEASNLLFEIFIGIIILWLARRFFITTMGCVHRIFHTQSTQQPLWIQAVASIAEIVFVMALAFIIFASSLIRTALDSSILNELFPILHTFVSPFISKIIPLILIFIVLAAVYRYGSGTHPSWHLCFLAAAACILLFLLVHNIFSITLNKDRYNLIYGILGKTIIALFELSFFFSFFLFFAQMLFVIQFFDYLLLAELYLMPEHGDTSILGSIHRMVFITPARFITPEKKATENEKKHEKENFFSIISGHYKPQTIYLKKGDTVYEKNVLEGYVYYIVKGSVELFKTNKLILKDRGASFGERGYLLHEPREYTACAKTDTILLRINEEAFSELIKKNSQAASKALSIVSPYFSSIYRGEKKLTSEN